MLPKVLINAALSRHAAIGREYDLSGKHVAYFLLVSPTWKVYRHSVTGMLALLRQMPKRD